MQLVRRVNYIALLDTDRCSDSIKAMFNSLKKQYGVEPEEVVLLVFSGLGESIYEGAYILRYRGYLVTHQAMISELIPPPYSMVGVPDLEIAYVGGSGLFLYELSILKYLGREVKPNIVSVGASEAKGSRYDFSKGLGQLLGYLDGGLSNEGYLIVPESVDRADEVREKGIGLVT